MKVIPDQTDTSSGNLLHLWLVQFITLIETYPGMKPTTACRLYFILGSLLWNSLAVIDGQFPFVDGFSTPMYTMTGATDHEKWEVFQEMLVLSWNALIASELPLLSPVTSPNPFPPPLPFRDSFVLNLTNYIQARYKDGYHETRPPFSYPNEGHYVVIGGEPLQNINTDLPSPTSWAPLSVLQTDQTYKNQSYVTPYFGLTQNWMTEVEYTAFQTLVDKYFPSDTLAAEQEAEMVKLQSSLTDDQRIKAEIWAGSEPGKAGPPGKWMIIIAILIASNQWALRESVAIVGGISFCLFHAGVAAWTVKGAYLQPRPIQAIRRDYYGQPIVHPLTGQVADGGAWLPWQESSLYTPGFPDFISGHSTFSMACAVFLQMILRSDIIPIQGCLIEPSYMQLTSSVFDLNTQPFLFGSITLPTGCSKVNPAYPTTQVEESWSTWSSLAREVGISRVYGGIHWNNSNLGGFAVGQYIGQFILQYIHWDSLGLQF